MSAQPMRTGEAIKALVSRIQHVKPPSLRFLDGEDSGLTRKKITITYEIETISPDTQSGAERWKELHNDPQIKIMAEKDYMNQRDGLKTVIRYAVHTEELPEDPDELAEDLLS